MSREKFDQIDADGDGLITGGELRASLEGTSGISDEDVATIMQMADDDEDRQISFAEYVSAPRLTAELTRRGRRGTVMSRRSGRLRATALAPVRSGDGPDWAIA